MKRKRRWFVAALALSALLAGLPSTASAQSLYGDQAPPDSAYVRVYRAAAAAGAEAQELTLGSTRFAIGSPGLSAYRPVNPGIYQIAVAGSAAEIIPQARTYYTVALMAERIEVFEDPAYTDPARAEVVLYNLSGLPNVELRTRDGNTRVIPSLAPGAVGRIAVNAVPVALAVFSGDRLLHALGDLGLERGSSYSVLLSDTDDGTGVLWARAELQLD